MLINCPSQGSVAPACPWLKLLSVLLIRDDLMSSSCQKSPGLNKCVTIRCSLSGTLAATQFFMS